MFSFFFSLAFLTLQKDFLLSCLSSQLLHVNVHALPYITSIPLWSAVSTFHVCLCDWTSVFACESSHTCACLWDMSELLVLESEGGLLLNPPLLNHTHTIPCTSAGAAVAAAATAGWFPWEKSISWVNGRDGSRWGQTVVNNQGRIGKALIPFFVLLHLYRGGDGTGLRVQGTPGSC